MPARTSTPSLLECSIAHSAFAAPLRVAAVALAVALTAATAQLALPVPFTMVPFTLTPLAVILTGAVLGARLGALAQAAYVLLGIVGFAVFAPSATLPPGALRVVGPTGGYLLSYPVAAFATGWLAERGWCSRYRGALLTMLGGIAIIYAGGVAWLTVAFTHSIRGAITLGLAQFLVLDVVKAIAAAAMLPAAWRFVGRADR